MDAAINSATNSAGVGVVIRDSEGNFLAGRTCVIHGLANPHRAELLAPREGLTLAMERGLSGVYLKGDAKASLQEHQGW